MTHSQRKVSLLFAFASALVLFVLLVSAPARADGGDFTLDLTAAAGPTYNHDTGGGAFNNDTSGSDTTEQLEPQHFACADVVSYLTEITVDGSPTASSQTIQIDYRFDADTTGQTGVGIGDVVGASVNYGQVENGDDYTGNSPGKGFFGLDGGIHDDRQDSGGDTTIGGSTATIISEGFINGGLFDAGAKYAATIQIDDFEAGDVVILRVDARLFCLPGSSPTGNVSAGIHAARVVSPIPDAISVGTQTIPLKVGQGFGFPDPVDFGDLPDGLGGAPSYPTLAASNGARHAIGSALYLGTCADSETDGLPSVSAVGDDADVSAAVIGTCVADDDEDGVSFLVGLAGNYNGWSNGTVASNNGGALTLKISGSSSGRPQVFLDNGSGTLFDVGTLYNNSGVPWATPFPAGTYNVYFDIPDNFFDGANNTTVYTRVRLSTAGGLLAGGQAPDGEVEDYVYNLGPTAISRQSIGATSEAGSLLGIAAASLLLFALTGVVLRRRRS